ncbi:MAG: hypothetical protein KDC69_09435 [Flavobacteriaceae bacterium]|nr:hypothetical protein [Flavobacteriaceae bacterium]
MKKLNLLVGILLGFIILSCSSDENTNSTSQVPQLIRIDRTSVGLGPGSPIQSAEFINNRPNIINYFDENNNLTYYFVYSYNTNDLLIEIDEFYANNDHRSKTEITYDSQNRIIQIKNENLEFNYTSWTVDYTFNSDNTISSYSESYFSGTQEKTFIINSNGYIDKEIIDGQEVVSTEYENSRLITKTTTFGVFNYSYLETGIFPFTLQNILGSNQINVVLYHNTLDPDTFLSSLSTDLVSEVSFYNIENLYTINEFSFPLTKTEYLNGEIIYESEYSYE